jgi:hypothetical protein
MYPSQEAREIAILMKTSRELDVCGDVTVTVDSPSELIAWASVLVDPAIVAWHASDSGSRFVQVSAHHQRAPVRGRVAAVLTCNQHPEFWDALGVTDLPTGPARSLSLRDLTRAWEALPLTPPDGVDLPAPPPGPHDAAEAIGDAGSVRSQRIHA